MDEVGAELGSGDADGGIHREGVLGSLGCDSGGQCGWLARGLRGSAACSWMRRTEGLVFGSTDRWICGWIRAAGDGRAGGKSGGRKRARQPDLRIRRREEIAGNRQSHCAARPISTTAELARVISTAAHSMKGEKIHPATKTFQAIRIRVNDELARFKRC